MAVTGAAAADDNDNYDNNNNNDIEICKECHVSELYLRRRQSPDE